MRPVSDLAIDSFLPLAHMQQIQSRRMPRILPPNPIRTSFWMTFLIRQLLMASWLSFRIAMRFAGSALINASEIKLASANETSFGPLTRLFLYHLNSITFLEFLTQVTGIKNLIPAPPL